MHATRRVRGFAAAVLLLAATLAACSTSNPAITGTPAATAIGMLGGSAQSAIFGSALAIPLSVHVTDQYGNGIAGVAVAFAARGGATVASGSVTTDTAGNAQTTATLGSVPGIDSITATITGDQVPVTFLETSAPGPAASIAMVSGDAQAGTSGAMLTLPLVVIVKDLSGNAIAGDSVTWTSSAGTVGAPASITVLGGMAQITFAPALGANTVTATINGTALITTFTETGN